MMLPLLILILIAGGFLAWLVARHNDLLARLTALASLLADLVIVLMIWMRQEGGEEAGSWLATYSHQWIPRYGISVHLAVDGLSLLLLVLTYFLGALSVLISWKEIRVKTGFFHFNLLWILAGITGVFVSLDMFLFYFFWELMLIPMYLLIGIWGHGNRLYASYKFFIYTQASGLLMLIAILALYFIHGRSSGVYTFDYLHLSGTVMPAGTSWLLMAGFLAAFLVKLPVVPLHNWLPDAHTEAPTAGSLILAGLLLKTGAYGLLRFVVPLFPETAAEFAPAAMILGIIGILYGAKLAFSQTDLKRLVAYTSVSHMGFVIFGIFAFTSMALQGVMMQIIAHGISTGALFILAGQLQERIHTRDIGKMGGLWSKMPVMGATALVFSMASLGLPGLGNFIAEFLTLAGSFRASMLMTGLACLGLVAATIYSLRIMQKIFYGGESTAMQMQDLSLREKIVSASLVVVIVILGLFPQKVLDTAGPSLDRILDAKSLKESVLNEAGEPITFMNEIP